MKTHLIIALSALFVSFAAFAQQGGGGGGGSSGGGASTGSGSGNRSQGSGQSANQNSGQQGRQNSGQQGIQNSNVKQNGAGGQNGTSIQGSVVTPSTSGPTQYRTGSFEGSADGLRPAEPNIGSGLTPVPQAAVSPGAASPSPSPSSSPTPAVTPGTNPPASPSPSSTAASQR